MAENKDGQDKTEQPSSKRLSKARGEGQVAKSQEINFVAGLMAVLIYFSLNGTLMLNGLKLFMQKYLSGSSLMNITKESIIKIQYDVVTDILRILLPYMVVIVVVALLSNIFQVGFLFTTKSLVPKFSRFNPVSGIKRLFNLKKVVEILKSILKIIVISAVPYLIIKSELDNLPLIMDTSVWAIMCYIFMIIARIFFYVAIVLLILAVIDLIYQRWNHKKELMMTKQEVKDEYKQAEGDPKVKVRIRQIQLSLTIKRMMDDVPNADLVVANPVHLAVALKYDRMSMDAPMVVAKGARLIAEKIKEIAREHNVPVVENKPLAQSLYKIVEVGDVIPDSLFKAVAEVLAFVYSRKNNARAAGY